YDEDSTIGHRLYKEITKVEYAKMNGKGRLTQPTNSYQWETPATNLEEFEQISVAQEEAWAKGKMRTHRSSKIRLIDEEIKEDMVSVSGHAPMDGCSDVEVLDATTDAPLFVVVPASEASSSKHRKTVVIEGSDEEEMDGGEREKGEGSVDPSGDEREEIDQSDHSKEESTESE
ncbi:hypothetical protein GIB67_037839, partial [Kingdonia uniflora]